MAMIYERVASSTGDSSYMVGYDPATGDNSCECDGRKFRSTCRHIKTLMSRIALGVVSSDPAAEGAQTMPDTEKDAGPASQPAASTEYPIRPMLAKPIPSALSLDAFMNDPQWRMEGGIRGHRTLIRKVGRVVEAWTSDGRDATSKLSTGVIAALRQMPDCILDGTLYVRGGKPSAIGAKGWASALRYAAFDIIELAGAKLGDLPLMQRREMLVLTVEHHSAGKIDPMVFASPLVKVSKPALRAFIRQGVVTIILKHVDGKYRSGSMSTDWKKFNAEDYV